MQRNGLSPERLGRMHDVLAGYVARGAVPGLVGLVSRGDEVHVDVIGAKAAGEPDPMRRDTIFRLASVTKPITAAAAMTLVEECTLRLDDPVDRWLPELANRRVLTRLDAPLNAPCETVPANRPITLRDLLTFRMGFGVVFAPPDTYPIQRKMDELRLGYVPDPQTVPPPDEWMRRLGTLPLMHQPGEQWQYQVSSDVLGVLIARATGQPLEIVLQERLFAPLGMTDTGFSVPAEKLDRLAASYFTDPDSGALDPFDTAADSRWSRPPAFPSASAGLVSTVDDLHAFARMLLDHGTHDGTRILSRPTVELMMTDHLTPEQKWLSEYTPGYFTGHGWGFGGSVVTRHEDVAGTIGKYGWDGGLGTSWYVDPREEMVTILLTQASFTSPVPPDVIRDFWTSAYQAIDD